jgi:hypothetical protein
MPRKGFAVAFKVCLNYIKEQGFVGQVQTGKEDSLNIVGDNLSLMFLSLPKFFSPVHKQDAIQMVDLMLEDASQPTFGFDGHRVTMPV